MDGLLLHTSSVETTYLGGVYVVLKKHDKFLRVNKA